MKKVPVSQVGYDKQYYPRVNGKEDWLTVLRYKEALQCHPEKADPRKPGAFPPLVVAKATGYRFPYVLLDGLHRLRAFAQAGYETVPVEVENLPKSAWLRRSVELNIDGKRPLDAGDKRWVAKRLQAEGWKPEKIMALMEMTSPSFEKLVATNIQKITGKGAKEIPEGRGNRQVNGDRYGFLKAPFGEAAGTANAEEVLKGQGSVSAQNARQIVDSFVALLESGCLDLTDEVMAGRLREAQRLLGEVLGAG